MGGALAEAGGTSMKKQFGPSSFPQKSLGSSPLPRGYIEGKKKRVMRDFKALQDELDRLEDSMLASDWADFNRPL